MPSLVDQTLALSILIMNPDAARRGALLNMCGAQTTRIRSASTFEEARTQIAAEPPDVLITDLRLGPFNGLHLVLRSRSHHPKMAAIVMSTSSDAAQGVEVARHKAVFLVYPFTDGEFLSALDRCRALSGLHAPPG